jgi:hypothetical protein
MKPKRRIADPQIQLTCEEAGPQMTVLPGAQRASGHINADRQRYACPCCRSEKPGIVRCSRGKLPIWICVCKSYLPLDPQIPASAYTNVRRRPGGASPTRVGAGGASTVETTTVVSRHGFGIQRPREVEGTEAAWMAESGAAARNGCRFKPGPPTCNRRRNQRGRVFLAMGPERCPWGKELSALHRQSILSFY